MNDVVACVYNNPMWSLRTHARKFPSILYAFGEKGKIVELQTYIFMILVGILTNARSYISDICTMNMTIHMHSAYDYQYAYSAYDYPYIWLSERRLCSYMVLTNVRS